MREQRLLTGNNNEIIMRIQMVAMKRCFAYRLVFYSQIKLSEVINENLDQSVVSHIV